MNSWATKPNEVNKQNNTKSSSFLSKHAKKYASETSLHGIKYIAEDNRHWSERVLWFLLCMTSVVFGGIFIYPILMKWNNFPTITTILQTNYPISKIPFPAVTICSNNKVFNSKLIEVVDDDKGPLQGAMKKLDVDRWSLTGTLSEALRRYIYFFEEKDLEEDIQKPENIDQYYLINNYSSKMPDILKSVMLPCEEMILACQWEGNLEKCGELFQVKKSDSGFCCSFNYIHKEKQMNVGNPDVQSKEHRTGARLSYENKTLKRTHSANSLLGLSILLHGNRKEYTRDYVENLAANHYYGFKVLVHDPYEFPEVSGKGVPLSVGQEAFISVSPQYVESSDKVKTMSLETRKCIYFDEDPASIPESFRPKLFKQYTMLDCLFECRAKRIMKECGCLPYYYPDFKTVWNRETSCNVTGLQCLADKYVSLRSKATKDAYEGCECPEDCDKTSYYPEISQVPLIPRRVIHWLTVRMDEEMARQNKIVATIGVLEYNDWTGLDENDTPIEWEGENLAELSSFVDEERKKEEIEQHMAGDLSLAHIYFKDINVVKYQKEENYGSMDLVAAFGGIVGLCMGFSLLSLAEAVYFFTMRLIIDKFITNTRTHTVRSN